MYKFLVTVIKNSMNTYYTPPPQGYRDIFPPFPTHRICLKMSNKPACGVCYRGGGGGGPDSTRNKKSKFKSKKKSKFSKKGRKSQKKFLKFSKVCKKCDKLSN